MHYCGVVPAQRALQLAVLEEVRGPEPPVRLSALFFEPGTADQVAAELRSLDEVVVAVGGPLSLAAEEGGARGCDEAAARHGLPVPGPHPELLRLGALAHGLSLYQPFDEPEGPVQEGAYRAAPLFETSADGVFYALQGRRIPAKRHPLGMQIRIEELIGDHVVDDGGELWHRRIEELDAAACALCAHRFAVGHASWLGDPAEAVIVLPGAALPAEFTAGGVLPPIERLQLPPVTRA